MRIEVIKTYEAFANLKDDWEAVYAADPDAQFFLSWTWFSGWLRHTPKWFVLVAKPDASSPPVAVFPIRLRVKGTPAGAMIKEVAMAGNNAADYTGFICRPECDDEVIPAFAAYVKRIKWDHLHLQNFCMSPQRVRRFLSCFPSEMYGCQFVKMFNKNQKIDNYICPYVPLTDTWDSYLSKSLKGNTRHNVRRYLARVEKSADFSITHADEHTADRDIDILLHFWSLKWGWAKGEQLTNVQNTTRILLWHSLSTGHLFLPVLWKGQNPVGAVSSFLDKKNKSVMVYMQGRDESFNNPPPGFVLHAYGIRWAINNGFRTYDFMRGNEPYKYSFGCQERQIWHIVVSARSAEAPAVEALTAHLHFQPTLTTGSIHQPA